MDISSKKTNERLTGEWKDAQHHQSPGRCKSKPRRDSTSRQWSWLLFFLNDRCWQNVEKRKPLDIIGVNIIGSAAMEVWRFLKTIKIESLCDPAIPLQNIYPKELKPGSWRSSHTPSSLWHYPRWPTSVCGHTFGPRAGAPVTLCPPRVLRQTTG